MFFNKGSHSKFLWLSIAASILTILLKFTAYFITGSVGLFSDAIESIINLTAGIIALIMMTIALSPPDKEHPFGHHKAEYFASVTEGVLIFIAAIAIGVISVERILYPRELEQIGSGLLISVAASGINFFTAIVLIKAGRKYKSITLEADGKHLMTDVWTTGGVLAGLLLVKITGWTILDPIVAILVALNIIYTGIKLVMRSVSADGLCTF
jgi:cation diffusion facilitator family transporter